MKKGVVRLNKIKHHIKTVLSEERESCQKQHQVRTGLFEKEGKLSEAASSSDSFGQERGKAVLINP
ncbi:hypothetical protein DYI25_16235 [Mesobacillus boroniphilus]|uniref:Uncharacterized protein n=1 Tax=Mesobacillus boroniphilus TaxID=308892 RepID=A0A944CNG8_9BACI|nr:hypothetical protein [Mesobacillus boroniphilus]